MSSGLKVGGDWVVGFPGIQNVVDLWIHAVGH